MKKYSSNFHILCIGGEEAWVQTLQRAISSFGKLDIVQAEGWLSVVKTESYDVILLDWGVFKDPPAIIARLRERAPDSLLIVITASPTWRRARAALKAGANDYIRKTFNEQKLHIEIEKTFQRAGLHSSNEEG
jgi:DNA-binding response OmpR family regulator